MAKKSREITVGRGRHVHQTLGTEPKQQVEDKKKEKAAEVETETETEKKNANPTHTHDDYVGRKSKMAEILSLRY